MGEASELQQSASRFRGGFRRYGILADITVLLWSQEWRLMTTQRVFVSWCWATRFISQEVRIASLHSNLSALMGALDCARQVHAHDVAKVVQNMLIAEAHSVLRWCLNAWRDYAKAVMAMEQEKLLQD